MLGDPTKLRNVPMTIRFTRKERIMIEVLAEMAGEEPSFGGAHGRATTPVVEEGIA